MAIRPDRFSVLVQYLSASPQVVFEIAHRAAKSLLNSNSALLTLTTLDPDIPMASTRRILDVLRHGQPAETLTVKGWVRTKREQKEFSFIEVNDGSSMAGLQVVVSQDVPGYTDTIKRLSTGASVTVSGTLVESPAKGQRIELKAESLEVFGEADPETYPLQKKRHSFEFLRDIAHLRARTNTLGAVFRVRNAASTAIHQFFQERGFLWVHTPIIGASDCEGAGEMFTVTGFDLKKVPLTEDKQAVDFGKDFFGKQAFLTVSGQLEAEIMAMAFSNVYTFGPTFQHLSPPGRVLDGGARDGLLRLAR